MCEGIEKGTVSILLHLLCAGLLGRDLSTNALHGPIPETLLQLMQLENLYLHSNTLTSTISSRIGNLKKLTNL